jgi:hypothetical protein
MQRHESAAAAAMGEEEVTALKNARSFVGGIFAAQKSFPNATGNYRGKRTPKPLGKPVTPAERFARLQATFEDLRVSPAERIHFLSEALSRPMELTRERRQALQRKLRRAIRAHLRRR